MATAPTLEHRTPTFEFLPGPVERVDAAWVDARFDELLEAAGALAADDGDGWDRVVRWRNELVSHFASHSSRTSLAFRQQSDDPARQAEYQRFTQEVAPAFETRDLGFARLVVDSGAVDTIEQLHGPVFAHGIRTTVRASDPASIALGAEATRVLMRHTETFGALQVRWRGETKPWSFWRRGAVEPDRASRHDSYRSMVEALQAVEGDLEQVFDEVSRLRREQAAALGYPSFVDLRYDEMGRIDWTPVDAARFRQAVLDHVVPATGRLRAQQAAQHGTELVHPADLELWPDDAHPEPAVGIDGQLATASSVFHALGPAFGDPFDRMREEDLIDLPARPGKMSGAFCTSLFDERVPFIFCNSTGGADDVETLVHEYGHALQQWRSADVELVELRWPTLEACEIHSMALELLAAPELTPFFGEAGTREFARERLRGSVLMLPYIASVDAFQHALYDPAREDVPDAAARRELWGDLTTQYRPGIDWAADPWFHEHRWLSQQHVFHNPFYYLDYGLAQVVAWQLWALAEDDRPRALETYLRLCEAGGTKPFRTLVREAGLADPFDPAVVARVVGRVLEAVA